jgi:DNA helicase-2/ATP-dependent DNA helicase PcrA
MPDAVRDILRNVGWSEQPPAGRGAVRERWDAMQALVGLADALAVEPPEGRDRAGVADLVAELDERAAAQHAPTIDGVTLASLHAAKGLEWDAVFLVGAREGLIPTLQAETAAAVAEERRLLYVGVTRAREHLQVSYAQASRPGGRASRSVTRFLRDVWPDGRSVDRGAGAARRSVDARVAERLTAWCADRARADGVPASSLLTPAQIDAVAQLRPRNLAELATVRGMGQQKLRSIGDAVLAAVAGDPVARH